jgi:hypothetical protein
MEGALAERGDYLGIHMADGNEPFGREVLQEIAGIAGVADDIDAVERLRVALMPMGSEYRRIIAMVPSELKGAPGHESHSERLEWLDTQILNPLKRLLPALAEDRRYMFSMWPQEVRPHDLPDWELLRENLEFLENLARNATLAIAFYRHHELSMGPLLRYRIVSSAMDALKRALPALKPSRGTYDKDTKGFNGAYPDLIRAIYKEITGEQEQLDRQIKELIDERRNPQGDAPDKPFVLGDHLTAIAKQAN